MFDQFLDSFRQASESTLHAQQDLLKQWSQQWLTAPPIATGRSAEWGREFQQRWVELTIDALNKQRESLDASYKAGIQIIEKTLRLSDAKSADDRRQLAEELWKNLLETLKTQYESQFQEFQKWTERSFDLARQSQAAQAQSTPAQG